MGIGRSSGSGLSPGASPIWPGGASSKELAPASDVEETFQSNRSVTGDKSVGGAAGLESTSTQAAQKTQDAAVVKPEINKPLTPADIMKELANLKNVDMNDTNKALAFLMIEHGVEINSDNFSLLRKLIKGKKSQSAFESAVLLLSKGLGEQVTILA